MVDNLDCVGVDKEDSVEEDTLDCEGSGRKVLLLELVEQDVAATPVLGEEEGMSNGRGNEGEVDDVWGSAGTVEHETLLVSPYAEELC